MQGRKIQMNYNILRGIGENVASRKQEQAAVTKGLSDDNNKQRIKNQRTRDFPGGAVVKNPPANAGDTGLIPGPGRSHMPPSN